MLIDQTLTYSAGGGQMASFILNLAETVGTVAQRDLVRFLIGSNKFDINARNYNKIVVL